MIKKLLCNTFSHKIEYTSRDRKKRLNGGILRSYVRRMGLARGEEVPAVAVEVLQEVVIEALDHADRFNPTGQPMAWLLGIAINVIRRKKVELAKRSQRELSIGELSLAQEEHLSEHELFDQITADSSAEPDQEIAANEQAELLLLNS